MFLKVYHSKNPFNEVRYHWYWQVTADAKLSFKSSFLNIIFLREYFNKKCLLNLVFICNNFRFIT